jgi:hypothetical protein
MYILHVICSPDVWWKFQKKTFGNSIMLIHRQYHSRVHMCADVLP